MDILDKPTERGYLAYAHASRVATTYQHWPQEAYEANQAKFPTLRVLSYVQNISGAELEHIPNIQAPNHIATSLRAVSKEVGGIRARRRENTQQISHQKSTSSKYGTNTNHSNTRIGY